MLNLCRKTTLVGVTALLLCVVPNLEASAQRTMRGESLLSAEVHYPFSKPYWLGADLSYGEYLLNSYWKAGASVTEYTHSLPDEVSMGYLHATAYGEWMYRLVGTRSRCFCMYGGGGAFLGYEGVDAFSLLPAEMKEDFGSGYFLYGVSVSLELEVFFSKRVAFILNGRLPLNFSSQFGWFHYQAGAGLRLNIG